MVIVRGLRLVGHKRGGGGEWEWKLGGRGND
jgi:hypothetical protein